MFPEKVPGSYRVHRKGPSLTGASAMQHIQPRSRRCSRLMLNRDLSSTRSPFRSADEREGARQQHGVIYLFTLNQRTGNVGQQRAARTDLRRTCPWWVKHSQPPRLHPSQAPPPQTWQRQIAMLIYVNPCQEDMMHIMMPSAPPEINTNVQLNQQNTAQLSNTSMKS